MSLHVVLTNDIAEIQRLKTLFIEYGHTHQFSPECIQDVNLVFEEAISNIIFYGYTDEEQKHVRQIEVEIEFEDDTLILEIRDDAKPFDPLKAPEPDLDIPFDEREIGGMGIHLVRMLMNELEYKRVEGTNVLKMKKVLSFLEIDDGENS